jgi:phasin family protein
MSKDNLEIDMNQIPKEMLESQKSTLEAMMAVQGTVFSGFEKLVDLNLKVMKATMDEASQKTQEAMGVKDAQEAVAMTSSMIQPSTEKAVAYSKHVYDIVSGVQSDLSKLAEGRVAESQKHLSQAVDQFSRNAPTGTEGTISMIKSSLAQATAAYESMNKAAKQAADVAEKNLHAATDATFKAASDATSKASGRTRRSTT